MYEKLHETLYQREQSGSSVFYVGTNDVPSNEKAKSIAESIVSLSKEVKASKRDVSVSSITPCNDNWNNKVMEVNSYLMDLCESNDIPFISNATINPKKHLNNSRLHLNPKGSNKLRDNFVRYLKGLTSCEMVKQSWPGGVLDQMITFVLQLLKLLIIKNLVLSV